MDGAVTAMLKLTFPGRPTPQAGGEAVGPAPSNPPRRRRPFLGTFFTERRRASRSPALRDARGADQVIMLCAALLSTRGEVSATRLATDVFVAYQGLDRAGVHAFFDRLAQR